jgi:hypothetical protein
LLQAFAGDTDELLGGPASKGDHLDVRRRAPPRPRAKPTTEARVAPMRQPFDRRHRALGRLRAEVKRFFWPNGIAEAEPPPRPS